MSAIYEVAASPKAGRAVELEHRLLTTQCKHCLLPAHRPAIGFRDVSAACRLLHDQQLDCNFIAELSHGDQRHFRSIVMEMVLATDMKQHFALIAKFRTLVTHSHTISTSGAFLCC